MIRRRRVLPLLASVALTAVSVGIGGGAGIAPAGASTDPTTLSGEGGSFLEPVTNTLIDDDSKNLDGLFGGYVATGLDRGISDFIGSGAAQFAADFAVTERPLTPTEAAKAKADGRGYAYVPFAATPVAVATLVADTSYTGGANIDASQLCPHVDMTVQDAGAAFGIDSADPVGNWADPRFKCSTGQTLVSEGVTLAANADPTMANFAMMTYLDSDPTAKADFAAGLASGLTTHGATTSSTTPTETWPYTGQYQTAGGDQPFLGKLLTINAVTNVPSSFAADWVLGATFPISSVWTGSPLGAPLNIPTSAIQNAQGSYVAPSEAAAAASEADATVAATSDPTTNSVVTFNASPTDAAAYNSNLMEESYLVVPTNGLPANKDIALANLIRFVDGPSGQAEVKSFGAAPATAAMDAAGLQVAAELTAVAATTASTESSTTTTVPGSTTTIPGTGTGTGTGSTGSGSGTGTGSGTDPTGSGLAFTGTSELGPMVLLGTGLLLGGAVVRRRLRRRTAKP